ELLTRAEETALLTGFAGFDFTPFAFRGYLGRRRVTSFGERPDVARGAVQPSTPIPALLLPVRDRAAAFAGMAAEDLQQVLVTEYAPGAPIGWHRDRPEFGKIVGVSLGSPCRFRLRRPKDTGWERRTLTLAPRSAYLISGEARTDWEHSIPEVEALRYSITFRTLRAR
ncbi:MAG: alpha-ketoglutarate-dependent dioxygenase AlkB, partial [Pseudomonadota bacterium]